MLENKAQNSSGKQTLRSTKFHALSRVIKEDYSDFISFLTNTGVRFGEAAGLRWKHLLPSHPKSIEKDIIIKEGRER
jgi:integrase